VTTHQLAGLFDALRTNFGPMLKMEGAKAFEDVAEAFREQPDQPLRELVRQVRAAAATPSGNGRATAPRRTAGHAVDLPVLIDRIRGVRERAEAAEGVIAQFSTLNNAQLRSILGAFSVSPSNTTQRNLERVKGLLTATPTDTPAIPQPADTDTILVEQGVRLFQELKADPVISIYDVRARMAPILQYPKTVVEEISRRLGYTPDDTREKTFDRMLSNLEGIKMSQLRAKMILN